MKKLPLILLLFLCSIDSSFAIPNNAWVMGSNWYCNDGYKKSGNSCLKINVPANAYTYGSTWYCNIGYKKSGGRCNEMTYSEKQKQLEQIAIQNAINKTKEITIDSSEFSLRDVERKCEVYRYSDNYGDVECSGSNLRVVERKCEAYFSSEDDKYGDIECSGSELRPIERHCSASMYSDRYGDIDC